MLSDGQRDEHRNPRPSALSRCGSRSERERGDGIGAPIAGRARPGSADQMVMEKDE